MESGNFVGVSMIMEQYDVVGNCHSIAHEVHALLQDLRLIVIHHVHKESNTYADFLSHFPW